MCDDDMIVYTLYTGSVTCHWGSFLNILRILYYKNTIMYRIQFYAPQHFFFFFFFFAGLPMIYADWCHQNL